VKATVSFTKGAASATLPAPARFPTSLVETGQARGRTAGGETYVYGLGGTRHEAELEFRSLTSAQKSALADFFENHALGMKETWTYTDPAGGAFQARFAEPRLSFVKVAHDVWDVKVKLELTALLG
jgi:hypothetical protein